MQTDIQTRVAQWAQERQFIDNLDKRVVISDDWPNTFQDLLKEMVAHYYYYPDQEEIGYGSLMCYLRHQYTNYDVLLGLAGGQASRIIKRLKYAVHNAVEEYLIKRYGLQYLEWKAI